MAVFGISQLRLLQLTSLEGSIYHWDGYLYLWRYLFLQQKVIATKPN